MLNRIREKIAKEWAINFGCAVVACHVWGFAAWALLALLIWDNPWPGVAFQCFLICVFWTCMGYLAVTSNR